MQTITLTYADNQAFTMTPKASRILNIGRSRIVRTSAHVNRQLAAIEAWDNASTIRDNEARHIVENKAIKAAARKAAQDAARRITIREELAALQASNYTRRTAEDIEATRQALETLTNRQALEATYAATKAAQYSVRTAWFNRKNAPKDAFTTDAPMGELVDYRSGKNVDILLATQAYDSHSIDRLTADILSDKVCAMHPDLGCDKETIEDAYNPYTIAAISLRNGWDILENQRLDYKADHRLVPNVKHRAARIAANNIAENHLANRRTESRVRNAVKDVDVKRETKEMLYTVDWIASIVADTNEKMNRIHDSKVNYGQVVGIVDEYARQCADVVMKRTLTEEYAKVAMKRIKGENNGKALDAATLTSLTMSAHHKASNAARKEEDRVYNSFNTVNSDGSTNNSYIYASNSTPLGKEWKRFGESLDAVFEQVCAELPDGGFIAKMTDARGMINCPSCNTVIPRMNYNNHIYGQAHKGKSYCEAAQVLTGIRRGPKTIGDVKFTPAEKQARYRANKATRIHAIDASLLGLGEAKII